MTSRASRSDAAADAQARRASPAWHRVLLRGLLTVKPRQAHWSIAVRNALGVVLPLAVASAFGNVSAGLGMATGALVVMFSDQPGPYPLRFRRIVLTSLGGALAAFTGFSLGAHTALIVPVLALWAFLASLLVALGPAATRVGLTSIIVLLITASRTDLGSALPASGLILAGGLLQAVLAVLAWPFDRHRPEREMLAEAFLDLAAAARRPFASGAAPPESATINALQSAILTHGSQRSLGDERFFILVREYDQIRLALVALAELADGLPAPVRRGLEAWTAEVGKVLEEAALRIGREAPAGALPERLEELQEALAELRDRDASLGPMLARQLTDNAGKLVRHAAVVARNCNLAAAAAPATREGNATPMLLRPGNPLNILRANLGWQAQAFRHALRTSIVVTLCFAFVRHAALPHGYWLPMTAAIILKPEFGATFTQGALRTLGTISGLLVMSLVLDGLLVNAPLRLGALALLCFAFREMAPRHYGIGVAALSGMLVLLFGFAGEPALPVVEARATSTAAGSIIALLAYLAWPSWERSRVRPALADMLAAWAAYLRCLCRADDAAHGHARRAARATRSNAEASLERLRQEPRTGEGLLRNGELLLVAGNRLARVAMRVDALLLNQPELREHPELRNLLRVLADYTSHLAAALRAGQRVGTESRVEVDAALESLRGVLAGSPEVQVLREIAERFDAITSSLNAVVADLELRR